MGRPPARAPLAPPAADIPALTAAGIRAGDLYVCISEGWDAGFTVHAVACLITYAVCSYPRPFVHYCACFFLLYELSTPFMHLRTPPKLLPALGSGCTAAGKAPFVREVP